MYAFSDVWPLHTDHILHSKMMQLKLQQQHDVIGTSCEWLFGQIVFLSKGPVRKWPYVLNKVNPRRASKSPIGRLRIICGVC